MVDETMDTRELTYGEKAVGLKFNPSGDGDVDRIKKLYAEIIFSRNHRSSNCSNVGCKSYHMESRT